LVIETNLYYDARSEKHQIRRIVQAEGRSDMTNPTEVFATLRTGLKMKCISIWRTPMLQRALFLRRFPGFSRLSLG